MSCQASMLRSCAAVLKAAISPFNTQPPWLDPWRAAYTHSCLTSTESTFSGPSRMFLETDHLGWGCSSVIDHKSRAYQEWGLHPQCCEQWDGGGGGTAPKPWGPCPCKGGTDSVAVGLKDIWTIWILPSALLHSFPQRTHCITLNMPSGVRASSNHASKPGHGGGGRHCPCYFKLSTAMCLSQQSTCHIIAVVIYHYYIITFI